MLITISGTPGSGKTTVAKLLCARLRLPHIYAGDLYRRAAAERGISLAEFNRLSEQDHSIDRDLDARMAEHARAGNAILEGRLAAFIVQQEGVEALKVFLTASAAVRAQRVGQREGSDWQQVLEQNRVRQASDAGRYREIYGFDLGDTSIYDVVLDSDHATPDELAERVLAAVRQRYGAGAVPAA